MLERINVKELENSVKSIGDDWMLITVADEKNGRVNAMTASWGAMGVLWNKPVCICFVRPERYTFELLAEQKELSVAFLGSQRRDALAFCGRESGRDLDKLEKCGLTTLELDGIPVITEAQTALTCRVLYEGSLNKDGFLDKALLANYASAGYHRMFICEIIGAYKSI